MNDRFKFRVFDKETGKYYKSRINKCSGRTLYQHPSSTHCEWVTISTLFAELEQDEKIYTRTGVEPETIIEQCTGLKDKNGNLIYEGDVVLFNDDDYPWQIKWNEVFARWVLYSPLCSNEDGEEELTDTDTEYLKIIGNIHEQAEQKDK